MSRAVVLFTRDLRVRANPALAAAVREHDEVLPLFVLDRRLLARACGAPNRMSFLRDCLIDLQRSLAARGGRLIVRRGEVLAETMGLAAECGAEAIHLAEDPTPYARRRHGELAAAAARARVRLRAFPGPTVVAPGALQPADADHYRVFTPYWRVWHAVAPDSQPPAPRRLRVPPEPAGLDLRALERIAPPPDGGLAPGGEEAGRRLLERWLRGGLAAYGQQRDELAEPGTSRLSAHLHFGSLSALEVLGRTHGRPGADEFARQLCWRDFHHQVLAARPDVVHRDYRARGDRWRQDEDELGAWQAGLTGYPIVDAGMRQLLSEGFIHNRARLIVASFLTKTLYLDWRSGAAHFARLLQDADVANNIGNWQWVAGTGNDTRPNRVLNPLRQAKRFDPHGIYVRRHVPELAGVSGPAVHEPWRLPARERALLRYPAPIADLAVAAERLRAARAAPAG